jgi:hypothetical protein
VVGYPTSVLVALRRRGVLHLLVGCPHSSAFAFVDVGSEFALLRRRWVSRLGGGLPKLLWAPLPQRSSPFVRCEASCVVVRPFLDVVGLIGSGKTVVSIASIEERRKETGHDESRGPFP